MLNDYFVYDGVKSLDVGIRLQKQMVFSGAVPRVSSESVPGRNGELKFFDGSYENRTGTAECFALRENVGAALNQVSKWTMLNPGTYKRLEVSNEPEFYRMACISAGPGTDIRVNLLAPFSLEFDCKPQKFYKNGEYPVAFTEAGVIYNPGFEALPLITVYGGGSGNISIGGVSVAISAIDEYIVLDCDTQNAYKGTANKNATIAAPVFPSLQPGANEISWSGNITKIEIIPRWWTL